MLVQIGIVLELVKHFVLLSMGINMKIIIIIMVVLNLSSLFSQSNLFSKIYIDGNVSSVIIDKNGDYLLIGTSTFSIAPGMNGTRILKINQLGETIWSKLYGNAKENTYGMKIIQSNNGNYLTSSTVYSPTPHSSGPSDIILSKLNVNGDTLWWNRYNINNSNIEYPNDLILNYDNSVFIIGRSQDQGLILKLDSIGMTLFSKMYNYGQGLLEFNSIAKIDSTNLFVFGSKSTITTNSRMFSKFFLLKTNLFGDSLSSFTIGDDSCVIYPNNIVKTTDGFFVLSGNVSQYSPSSNQYTLIQKFNKSGDLIWKNKLNGSWGKLQATSDSGIVFYNLGTATKVNLLKLNNANNILWNREVSFSGNQEINCNGIVETSNGNLLITGSVKFPNDNNAKIFLMKTTKDGYVNYVNFYNFSLSTFNLWENYPNPFNPSTFIKYQIPKAIKVTLKVFDILGKEIVTLVDRYQEAGSYNVKFDAGKLPSGVYIYRLEAGKFVESKKMILTK